MALLTLSMALCAAGQTTPGDRRLIEVSFAEDDKPPSQKFHIIETLWVSELEQGDERFVAGWAVQGGSSPDYHTLEKTAKVLKLLKPLEEPKILPDSPNRIVTVRCADGTKWIVKKFAIDKAPNKVHQILNIMGFPDGAFTNRLKFIK